MLTGPQTTPCPGTCNTAWRKAELARDHNDKPVPHTLRPQVGYPVWCDRCARGIAARLLELDDLVPMLEQELAGRRAGIDDGTGIKAPGNHTPSPSPVVDDLDEILRTLHLWEDSYRELRGFPPRPARPADLRFAHCIQWLHGRILGILGAPFAEELGRDVIRLHAMARRRTSTNPAKRRMPEPCPRCDLKAVTHHAGDAHVACERCGRVMLLRDWDAYCLDLAKAQKGTACTTGSPSNARSSSPAAAAPPSTGGSGSTASPSTSSPGSASSRSTSSSSSSVRLVEPREQADPARAPRSA